MKRNTHFKENVYTEIFIETNAENVWNIVTNFDRYAVWDIPLQISGQPVLNSPLIVQVNMSGRKPEIFAGRLSVCREKEELEWVVNKIAPILFSGKHAFVIESIGDNRVRFINKESFSGLVIPFIKKSLLGTKTEKLHNETNLVIKRLAEAL